jgi:hypothetical protein
MRIIEREYGVDKALEVMTCGTEDADFLRAIQQVAGITPQNFDRVVRAELQVE